MVKKEVLWIKDMTCRQCEKTLEHAVSRLDGMKYVKAEYESGKMTVEYDSSLCSKEQIARIVEQTGYQPGRKTQKISVIQMISLVVIVLGAVYLLNRLGLTGVISSVPEITEGMGYTTLFLIGLLTSVHCTAMCGGLNLTQSLRSGSSGSFRPSLLYNLGRLFSYTLIGGLLGGVGSILSISVKIRAGIGLFAGICMLFMALNMLNLVPFVRKIRIPFPEGIRKKLSYRKTGGSFYVGLLNGLMPCGPLQSMQLLAIAGGSVWKGALSMFFFCLGTIPLMLFFGVLVSAWKRKWKEKMMLAGTVLILVFSVSMIQNNAALLGIGALRNGSQETVSEKEDAVQYVTTVLQPYKYEAIEVKQGIPVEWTIVVPEGVLNGCNREILIPEYHLDIKLQVGNNTVTFVPEKAGTYPYSCWMGMIRSNIYVTE